MQKGLLYYIALGRGENGLILWSWRLSRKSKDKCGLHADYQVMWLCGVVMVKAIAKMPSQCLDEIQNL